MVDDEVVEILAEIKRRVSTAQERPLAETPRVPENSALASSPLSLPSRSNGFAGLSVMARAWDRLPPVVSNRTGTLARLELWIKEKFRSAFRWFTWEQVNFNAATHQTLLEMIDSLKAYEQHLTEIRQALDAQREELTQKLDAQRDELRQLSSLTTRLDQIDRQHLALIAQLNARLEGVSQLAKDQHAETQARLTELNSESRVRDEQLSDEQRVCYKQLSLELNESRVLEDRARRELEARLIKLETGQLENQK
ncbi:MAG TPA: hypothetical protein VJ749_01420 [Pyrinomonadaceae bacterium]|nr:hypothetical protein [Pyrinomonadaceae bacterium]